MTGTEADLLVLCGGRLGAAQPPAHHRGSVGERERLLAAGRGIEPGLAQSGDDGRYKLVVDAGERAALALQDREIAALAIHPYAEAAVDRAHFGGRREIGHQHGLRLRRRAAENVRAADIGATGKRQRGDTEGKGDETWNHAHPS